MHTPNRCLHLEDPCEPRDLSRHRLRNEDPRFRIRESLLHPRRLARRILPRVELRMGFTVVKIELRVELDEPRNVVLVRSADHWGGQQQPPQGTLSCLVTPDTDELRASNLSADVRFALRWMRRIRSAD